MTRTVQIAIVPNDAPNAKKRWLDLDPNAPAVVTYLQERSERGDVPPDQFPRLWRRTDELFAEHVPAGHHLVTVKVTDPKE